MSLLASMLDAFIQSALVLVNNVVFVVVVVVVVCRVYTSFINAKLEDCFKSSIRDRIKVAGVFPMQ